MKEEYESQNIPAAIRPAYQLEFSQPVWQLRFDDVAALVGVECRDADILQASFSVFEVADGKLLLDGYSTAAGWWTGLEDIRAGIMYLHGLKAGGGGSHSGITALAVATGTVIWQQTDYRFYGLANHQLLALPANSESTELIGLNIGTGEVIGVMSDIAQARESLERMQAHRLKYMQVPTHYPESNHYFADLSQFIQVKTSIKAQLAIDYLETDKYFVLGFYPERESQEKNYELAVFSISGDLLLREELGKDLSGIGTDNFFIFKDTLILLKNRRSLLAYLV